jgi:hypothetical protein
MKLTFSSVMRTLRQSKPEMVPSFLIEFQKNMFAAVEEEIEKPEQAALLQTISALKIQL